MSLRLRPVSFTSTGGDGAGGGPGTQLGVDAHALADRHLTGILEPSGHSVSRVGDEGIWKRDRVRLEKRRGCLEGMKEVQLFA